jgi:hypothetical protein
MYKLGSLSVRTFQAQTTQWRTQTTIQKVIIKFKNRRARFQLSTAPCGVVRKSGTMGTKFSNGFTIQFKGGRKIWLNAGCAGSSGYINVKIQDFATAKGSGQCFANSPPKPNPPRKCRVSLRSAQRKCRALRADKGLFAGCVDDVCAGGLTTNIINHLVALEGKCTKSCGKNKRCQRRCRVRACKNQCKSKACRRRCTRRPCKTNKCRCRRAKRSGVKRCQKNITKCSNQLVRYTVQVRTNQCLERQVDGMQCCIRFAYRAEKRTKTTRVCRKAKKAVFCGC